MTIRERIKNLWNETTHKKDKSQPEEQVSPLRPRASVYSPGGTVGPAQGVVFATFDGEKRLGDMGPARIYSKDFYILRARSKQLYLESGICFTVVNRFTEWVIGSGLKLKAEPQVNILKRNKIKIDTEKFNNTVEEVWKVYANSTVCDYADQQNLHGLCEEAHRESKKTGDILVVLRVINGYVKVQHIDGDHIGNPPGCTARFNDKKVVGAQSQSGFDWIYPDTGNRIRYGVEIDDTGKHVAYHVRIGITLKFKRIPARDSFGMLRAYMVYGAKPEIEATRGTPLVSVIMDEAMTLDRYMGAVVEGAEARANFALFFEHTKDSDGSDPLMGSRIKASLAQPGPGSNAANTGIAVDNLGNKIASDLAVSQSKTVVNLPNEVKAKSLESKQEVHVAEFTQFQIDVICAAMRIPPNVAMSSYNDSFSASRMAGKDWEHTFMTERADFAHQYLKPIYTLQAFAWTTTNVIDAPGLIESIRKGNVMVTESYLYSSFTGEMFPDIDPLKTVNFLRGALGPAFDHVPLMTPEAAAEILGQGGIDGILKQAGMELAKAESEGIEPIESNNAEADVENPDKPKPKKKKISK